MKVPIRSRGSMGIAARTAIVGCACAMGISRRLLPAARAFSVRPPQSVVKMDGGDLLNDRRVNRISRSYQSSGNSNDEFDRDEDEFTSPDLGAFAFENDEDAKMTGEEIVNLTVPQLKQQLRLRGLKVSGKKQELVERLINVAMRVTSPEPDEEEDDVDIDFDFDFDFDDDGTVEAELMSKTSSASNKAKQFAKEHGKELIDVTAYLEEEDKKKEYISSDDPAKSKEPAEESDESEDETESSGPETWGSQAKIVEDYEGRSPIVDGLSRTTVEFIGSNRTYVQAYVVASRDALKPYLANSGNKTEVAAPEKRLREIQMKREQSAKRPVELDDEALDDGDETNLYSNVIEREYSDWGEYSLTGMQLSAQEVQGVILLSDVYGFAEDDTRILAEKIAFECQPVVVMVPDLFRGEPWKEDQSTPGLNAKGQSYEDWRETHNELRVNVDIRAAASALRSQFRVSSVTLWGTCYGGGRALEAAVGYVPGGRITDVDGSIGPGPVNPSVVVAWYPTRYNTNILFGKYRKPSPIEDVGEKPDMAVFAAFAGNDELPGATRDDAAKLKSCLEQDPRVKDLMVKVFPNQEHGFAHIGLGKERESDDFERFVDDEFGGSGRVSRDDGDAEVACLLSTAFMETYARVFLPTTGVAIKEDEDAAEWNQDLDMKDLSEADTRDVRQEMEDAYKNFKSEPVGGIYIDPTDDSQQEQLVQVLRSMEKEDASGIYKIQDGDSVEICFAKLKANDPDFTLF